ISGLHSLGGGFVSFEHAYDIDLASTRFILLCETLNATVCEENATWSADILSGGLKFSDEIPQEMSNPQSLDVTSIELTLCLTTLMRRLWAYRMSLIEGTPRSDLAATWELTRSLAPQWAGFAPDRCSAKMRPLVDGVRCKTEQFDQDVD